MPVLEELSEIVLGKENDATVVLNHSLQTHDCEIAQSGVASSKKKHYAVLQEFGKVNVTVSFLCELYNVERIYYYKYSSQK